MLRTVRRVVHRAAGRAAATAPPPRSGLATRLDTFVASTVGRAAETAKRNSRNQDYTFLRTLLRWRFVALAVVAVLKYVFDVAGLVLLHHTDDAMLTPVPGPAAPDLQPAGEPAAEPAASPTSFGSFYK